MRALTPVSILLAWAVPAMVAMSQRPTAPETFSLPS